MEFTSEVIKNTSNTDGEDHSWSIDTFRDNFKVQIHDSKDSYDSTFSLIGLDPSIANAFRRVLIAEVPTTAIEDVYITNNTSIIQDEVLASRLGLIPLTGSKEGLDWMRWKRKASGDDPDEKDILADFNTIILQLDVDCGWAEGGKEAFKRGEKNLGKLYRNHNVYAKDLVYQPTGRQNEYFTGEGVIKPTNPDILIAKLRPGQSVHCTIHCCKGKGSDHAKFSPVATASYRLLPTIHILKPILGPDAKKFARCFPRGVIRLETVTKREAKQKGSGYEGHEGELKAVVNDPMKDTVSRECLRHDEFKDKVELGRIRDHFIFHVESTGQFESEDLFLESVRLLKRKCLTAKELMKDIMTA